MSESSIAIIGMAGRFPGARDVRELWRNLIAGVESIRGTPDTPPGHVPVVATMDGVDEFDAPFFGIAPATAEIMDPQHRVFLEVAWEALEDAGYDPERCNVPIGVYAGATANTYFAMNLASRPDVLARFSPIDLNTANANDFLTTRFSYLAGLTGPSYAVQAACATSLVAVCIACDAVIEGRCDIALAGGVSVNVTHLRGYPYVDGGMLSRDGHCRTFSAKASGTVFGNGAGVVVVRRLRDALAAGDHVYAVIKGYAVNNDGRHKVGYLAPSVGGQAQVIAEALAHADVSADAIGYVETHGTATPLGDPIEIRALTQAFRSSTNRTQFCRVGSVKTNVGHLDAAAGVTGLIKAVWTVSQGIVPATLHCDPANPAIEFETTPFSTNASTDVWPNEGPRCAGVSAFGVGGTNAHVIVEQAPPPRVSPPSDRWYVLPLSARSIEALRVAAARLCEWLAAHPDASLADVAYTLQMGRRAFRVRRAVVCQRVDAAVAALTRTEIEAPAAETEGGRPVALVGAGADTLGPWLEASGCRVSASFQDDAIGRDAAGRWAMENGGVLATVDVDVVTAAPVVRAAAQALGEDRDAALTRVVAALWTVGVDVNWLALHGAERRMRVPLPTYPFEHQRYWIDPHPREASANVAADALVHKTARPSLPVPYAAPRTPTERTIVAVWERTFGIEGIGIDDSFFDLGGDSVFAVRVAAALQEALHAEVPVAGLYEGVTVRHLAALFDREQSAAGAEPAYVAARRHVRQRRPIAGQP